MTGILKNKIAQIPLLPGVYLMKDASGTIIYIGKAKVLKKRVQSYFSRLLDSKTQKLVSKIADIEYRLTPTETQAQLLEAALIKEKQPQYNIDLKDDKTFPWIRITSDDFPIVSVVRIKHKRKDDTARYFGPYTNAGLMRQALTLIRRIFGFRSCRTLPQQPCLYYRLKLCQAPCANKVSKEAYTKVIDHIRLMLEGKTDDLIKKLSAEMLLKSKEQKFEEAAALRDQIDALSSLGQPGGGSSRQYELKSLQQLLKLPKIPERIEAFDISNISGKEATGSMVSFYKGSPDKNNYRRFRIKQVTRIDDYAMIREVVRRRYSRLAAEQLPFPDLVLIDGGKQHLLAALDELDALHISLPVISIAKDKENIYVKERLSPIAYSKENLALNLIRKIRDEAHRFALKYHHLLHKKKILGKS
jgi:excinuclease ABC subunit C